MKMFQNSVYPKKEEICQLAKSFNISERVIRQRFCNLRRKGKVLRVFAGSE